MSNTTMTDIEDFFRDHITYSPEPNAYSVLYFIRRDIRICMRDPKESDPHPALFAATMLVFAGIDLLGKFLAGEDSFKKGKPGKRFRRFFTRYFQTVSPDDAKIIYQLRNALMHSFGLYSRDNGNEYHFILSTGTGGPLITHQGSDHYLVDLRTLQDLFQNAIKEYHKDLQQDSSFQNNFAAMYPRYGKIPQRQPGHWRL
jgi:hypothetical protein